MRGVFRSNHMPEGTEFVCPRCNGYFKSGNPNIQCLVAHPEGDCCHYTDKPIPRPTHSHSHLGHHIGPCPTSEEMGLFIKKEKP